MHCCYFTLQNEIPANAILFQPWKRIKCKKTIVVFTFVRFKSGRLQHAGNIARESVLNTLHWRPTPSSKSDNHCDSRQPDIHASRSYTIETVEDFCYLGSYNHIKHRKLWQRSRTSWQSSSRFFQSYPKYGRAIRKSVLVKTGLYESLQ